MEDKHPRSCYVPSCVQLLLSLPCFTQQLPPVNPNASSKRSVLSSALSELHHELQTTDGSVSRVGSGQRLLEWLSQKWCIEQAGHGKSVQKFFSWVLGELRAGVAIEHEQLLTDYFRATFKVARAHVKCKHTTTREDQVMGPLSFLVQPLTAQNSIPSLLLAYGSSSAKSVCRLCGKKAKQSRFTPSTS